MTGVFTAPFDSGTEPYASGGPLQWGTGQGGMRVLFDGSGAPPITPEILSLTVDLDASQIIDLGTVPIVVIPAVPGGIVLPLRVTARFRVGSTPIPNNSGGTHLYWGTTTAYAAASDEATDPFGNALFYGSNNQTITFSTQIVGQNNGPVGLPITIQTDSPLYGSTGPITSLALANGVPAPGEHTAYGIGDVLTIQGASGDATVTVATMDPTPSLGAGIFDYELTGSGSFGQQIRILGDQTAYLGAQEVYQPRVQPNQMGFGGYGPFLTPTFDGTYTHLEFIAGQSNMGTLSSTGQLIMPLTPITGITPTNPGTAYFVSNDYTLVADLPGAGGYNPVGATVNVLAVDNKPTDIGTCTLTITYAVFPR